MSHQLMMINLIHAYFWFDEALQNSLRESGFPVSNRTQSLVLSHIANGETRASRIAKNIGLSRQAINHVLNGMIEQGVIVTRPDPADSRALLIEFNPEAAKFREAGIDALKHFETVLEERIGKKKVDALRNALDADWGPSPVTEAASDAPAKAD